MMFWPTFLWLDSDPEVIEAAEPSAKLLVWKNVSSGVSSWRGYSQRAVRSPESPRARVFRTEMRR